MIPINDAAQDNDESLISIVDAVQLAEMVIKLCNEIIILRGDM